MTGPTKLRISLRALLERALLVMALVSLGWYGMSSAESTLSQLRGRRDLDELRPRGPTHVPDATTEIDEGSADDESAEQIEVPYGSVFGRLEIPRLALSAIIREGDDARTLNLAAGHLPDTPWPGRPGNSAIAAHRDTFFRKLRHIERQDDILVTTPREVYRYVVVSTRVVNPDEVWVLSSTEESVLTLITCYPFSYVGNAPQRFIVRAVLAVQQHPASL
jgi:sortase A